MLYIINVRRHLRLTRLLKYWKCKQDCVTRLYETTIFPKVTISKRNNEDQNKGRSVLILKHGSYKISSSNSNTQLHRQLYYASEHKLLKSLERLRDLNILSIIFS